MTRGTGTSSPGRPGTVFVDRCLERPVLSGLPAVLLALLALPLVLDLEIDNSLEIWLDRDSETYKEYEAFRRTFGSEEFILAVYPCPETVDLPFLERLTDLRFELEEIDGVRRVVDLAKVYSKFFSVRGIDAFREELATSPFLRGFLVSPDRRLAATWIYLMRADGEERADGEDRSATTAAVEHTVRAFPPGLDLDPGSVHLAGAPSLNAALDRSSRKAARTFFPLVFLLSGAVLFALFRRLAGVVIPFVTVGTGILWTLAVVRLSGSSLNMVTITLPPIVWVLGLSTSIHLLSRWNQALAQGATGRAAARRALTELFRPCFYSAVTTAIGFASLLVSSMAPVREMGAFAALGILFCFASNFLLFPVLSGLHLRFSGQRFSGQRFSRQSRSAPSRPRYRDDHPILDHLVRWSGRPRLLLAVAGALSLALAAAIPRLRTELNPIRFFRAGSPIAVTYEQVLPRFTGPYSLEITLAPPALEAMGPEDPPDLDVLARLDELRDFLESRDGVARALSVADLVKKAHQEVSGGPYALPGNEADLHDAWRRIGPHSEELEAFFKDGVLRLTVLAQPMGTREHRELVRDLEDRLAHRIDPSWRPRLTGLVPLLVEVQERLVDSQVRTFGLTFLMVALVLGVLFRKLSFALLSLLPNLVPIVFALGTMGWLGIPLDPATVMIAGIALGIAATDTIHFLEHYRLECALGRTAHAAVVEALHDVGRPMVITSLVAALGFLVLCFSDFVPLFHFGLLTAVTMGAALVGDLVVLPALLLVSASWLRS